MTRQSPPSVRTLCLTGGIACGKTLVASFWARLGIPVIEADAVCHDLVRPGRPAHAAIVRAFGRNVLAPDGQVDRPALGRLVFADPARLAALNAILHPPARRAIAAWVAKGGPAGAPGVVAPGAGSTPPLQPGGFRIVAAVVPLVYEAGWESDWDRVVCVAAPPTLQRRRLAARGLASTEIRRRLAAQWPVPDKARRADAVIFNAGVPALAEEQARRIVERIRET